MIANMKMDNKQLMRKLTASQGTSQADRAYEFIRKAILDLTLMPGYPLSESDLAEVLGMSRTPIREAIQRLNIEGLVETIHRRGSFVKALSKEEIQDIYETNEGLEGMAAYLAAKRAKRGDIQRLSVCVEQMERSPHDNNAWILGDESFHMTLHQMAQNKYLADTLSHLYDCIHRIRLITLRAFDNKEQSTREHRATYEAIRLGDAEMARRITQDHWRRVRCELLGAFGGQKSESLCGMYGVLKAESSTDDDIS